MNGWDVHFACSRGNDLGNTLSEQALYPFKPKDIGAFVCARRNRPEWVQQHSHHVTHSVT